MTLTTTIVDPKTILFATIETNTNKDTNKTHTYIFRQKFTIQSTSYKAYLPIPPRAKLAIKTVNFSAR